jgi:hypothetical protein
VIEDLRHRDVAALDQPQRRPRRGAEAMWHHVGDPGAGGIHQRAGRNGRLGAGARVAQFDQPMVAVAPRRDHLGAQADVRPAPRRVHGVEDDEPRIVHPAVGIFEAAAVVRLERRPGRIAREVERARRGQDLASAEMIVEEQPEPDQQGRAQRAVMRQHEAQRADDVRRHPQQHLALLQRLAHEAERVVLEIAQPAVNELGRGRRRAAGEVALLGEDHRKTSPRRVACNPATVHAPADDGDVIHSVARRDPPPGVRLVSIDR